MKKVKTEIYNDKPKQITKLTDAEQANAWYALAADSDENHEQAELCQLYCKKGGVDWYINAAANGDAYAMYSLGKMYHHGIGVDINDTKSAAWFSKASSSGISYAHYELAKMCMNGIGLDADKEYASSLFKLTFKVMQSQEKESPNPYAEYILATLYEQGLGINKDLNLAQYWRNLADKGKPFPAEAKEKEVLDNSMEQPDTSPITSFTLQHSEPKKALKFPKVKEKTIKLPKKTIKSETPKQKNQSNTVDNIHSFIDMIIPSVTDFKHSDYFICGNTFRCVWAIREYPTETDQLAILRDLGEKSGITLHVYINPVTASEENKIIRLAERRNRHKKNTAHDMQSSISADVNIQDVQTLITNRYRSKETLVHCAVFIELIANSYDELKKLQNETTSICTRSKLICDKLWLRQKDGFLTVMPAGNNKFKFEFERVMPSSSVGNLYPFSYSGKTDSNGMFIGKDVNGTNIIIDFDLRSSSKTNGHILILGNSGEGKSFLSYSQLSF